MCPQQCLATSRTRLGRSPSPPQTLGAVQPIWGARQGWRGEWRVAASTERQARNSRESSARRRPAWTLQSQVETWRPSLVWLPLMGELSSVEQTQHVQTALGRMLGAQWRGGESQEAMGRA